MLSVYLPFCNKFKGTVSREDVQFEYAMLYNKDVRDVDCASLIMVKFLLGSVIAALSRIRPLRKLVTMSLRGESDDEVWLMSIFEAGSSTKSV